jgi:hypothetical protein
MKYPVEKLSAFKVLERISVNASYPICAFSLLPQFS